MHRAKVLHNDVKSASILFHCDRGAVLCDFGLSSVPLQRPLYCGTPRYLAPELLLRESPTPAFDV
ncbi:hypothetical protein B0T25DRAFT_536822 [Lasiosphaeria hispida]|uniref:Protein kinase domain-containing protein n=1 Tax=Lasiosphaeria hispida TaxID=260671 RepID=A0AAJ0MF81_9PEZI|nr:hypothetical protein B0T25DRAFT_536822 [Lasiosphaeria hispida]